MAEIRNAGFGGYNKKDVMLYIKRLKNSFRRKNLSLLSQIESLEEKISSLEEEIDMYKSERASFIAEKDKYKTDIECLNGVISDLNDEIEALKNASNDIKNGLKDEANNSSEIFNNITPIASVKRTKVKLTIRGKKRVKDVVEDDFNVVLPNGARKVKVSDIKVY